VSAPGSGSALVIMPRETTAWPGAQALWITARGWADAAAERFGAAWIVTPDGVWEPGEIPRPRHGRPSAGRRLPIPITLRTLAKDLRLRRRQRSFRVPGDGPWVSSQVRLVWEHHDLFNDAGRPWAATRGVPLVRYVHAPQVWEARKWGVRRTGWGRLLEAGEIRRLEGADLVACVSPMVRNRLAALGVDPSRIVIAPMGVDAETFTPDGRHVRDSLAIPTDAVVVGWTGSFRSFHGLEGILVAFGSAAARDRRLHLLLVGDGPARGALERQSIDAGLAGRVTFTGTVSHAAMPTFLRAMDLAVVSSAAHGGFHYSPLKLREYAACGLPVVAPAEGELSELRETGFVHLHPPADTDRLGAVLLGLAADPSSRRRQSAEARAHAVAHWTWSAHLDRVLRHLAR
jgi:glycosyltransferase involved in cell wall biosynthesis